MSTRPMKPRTADRIMIRFLWLIELLCASDKEEAGIDVEEASEFEIAVLPEDPPITTFVVGVEVAVVDVCDGSEDEVKIDNGT